MKPQGKDSYNPNYMKAWRIKNAQKVKGYNKKHNIIIHKKVNKKDSIEWEYGGINPKLIKKYYDKR